MFSKKPRIGDILEIKIPAGLRYIQYTHHVIDMGALVRVLPGLFGTRPTDFAHLAGQKELYFVFYTLDYAIRNKQVEIASRQPVPEWARPYPLMRWRGDARDQNGKTIAWKIFKASDLLTIETHQRTPVIRTLTPEQEKLSVHELWPHPVMVRELTRGWTPECAEELRLRARTEATKHKMGNISSNESTEKGMRHYIYFPQKMVAERSVERLRDRGFSVEVRKGADGMNWLVLVTMFPPKSSEQMDELQNELEALAGELGGEYDGWEVAVDSPGQQIGGSSQIVQ
jgi:Regulator of ribonuclease activity B